MKEIQVKKVMIGKGRPKICVSLTGGTKKEILSEAQELQKFPVELAEWRADYFEQIEDIEKMLDVLWSLEEILNEIPLIFTFRTKKEGGKRQIGTEEYMELIKKAAWKGHPDMIDVELSLGKEEVKEIVSFLHKYKIRAIVSVHDFQKTPCQEELISCFQTIQTTGADICKIAVMPQVKKDVLILLNASEEIQRKYADRPYIMISMGEEGKISRICGELTGSAVTFGTIDKASAPGQIPVEELDQILNIFRGNK